MTNKLQTLIIDNDQNMEMACNIFACEYEIYTDLQDKYWQKIYDLITTYNCQDDNLSFKTIEDRVSRHIICEFYTKKRNTTKNYGFSFYVNLDDDTPIICKIENKRDSIYWGIPGWGYAKEQNSRIIRDDLNIRDNTAIGKNETSWKFLKPLCDNNTHINFNNIPVEFAKLINNDQLLKSHLNTVIENITKDLKAILDLYKNNSKQK